VVSKASQTPSIVVPDLAVRVNRVSKTFHNGRVAVRALVNASLSVRGGEFVAVMGPSGSGKSTLLHLIAGLDVPTDGTIHVRGRCVSALNDTAVTVFRRQNIGLIYQNFKFLPDLTIEENVGLPLMLDGRRRADIAERVERVLEQVDMNERRHHTPGEVSGGELQRAAIARALVADPAVLLADEPTGNLDSVSGERVLLDMRRAVDELRRTVILVTHDSKAAAYADRIERLLDGSFVDGAH
jgi:putative ABC transport system ATP-binding protein